MKNKQPKSKNPGTAVAKTPAPAAAVEDKKNVLQITAREGVSEERQLADLATDGIASNAMTARAYLGASQPQLSITEMVASLKDHGKRVNANDFDAAEQMLSAQSIALNAIFAEMARRAALNMGEHMDAAERYMRLALKAQGQCRATVEALAAIKNPPIVYAKQANIAHGPQQVNNGNGGAPNYASGTPVRASGESDSGQSKLIEGTEYGGTSMDAGATRTATRSHSAMEALGAVHRADKRGRQG